MQWDGFAVGKRRENTRTRRVAVVGSACQSRSRETKGVAGVPGSTSRAPLRSTKGDQPARGLATVSWVPGKQGRRGHAARQALHVGSGSDNVDNDGTDVVVVDDSKRSDDRRRTGRGEESVELGFGFSYLFFFSE